MGRRALRGLPLLICLALPALAAEGTVSGTVSVYVEKDGQRLRAADASDVVVYLTGFTQPAPDALAVMGQKDRTFTPSVLPIVKGQAVLFPNRDPLLHNVFSRSRAAGQEGKAASTGRAGFDLGKYRDSDPPKTVRFDKSTGVVDVYCDIHEDMAASILVLPNRAFAVTDARGSFRIRGVPPGTWTAFAWSRRAQPQRVQVQVKPGGEAKLSFELLEGGQQREQHHDKYGRPYKTRGGYD